MADSAHPIVDQTISFLYPFVKNGGEVDLNNSSRWLTGWTKEQYQQALDRLTIRGYSRQGVQYSHDYHRCPSTAAFSDRWCPFQAVSKALFRAHVEGHLKVAIHLKEPACLPFWLFLTKEWCGHRPNAEWDNGRPRALRRAWSRASSRSSGSKRGAFISYDII